jgi:hypothetical protein
MEFRDEERGAGARQARNSGYKGMMIHVALLKNADLAIPPDM